MDVSEMGDLDIAADAFLTAFADAPNEPSNEDGENDTETKRKKVSPDTEDETTDEPDTDETDEHDAPSDEEEEGDEEGEDDKGKARKYADDDETYVKVKVGDDEHEVAVKDLKRLFGQESALTKRSQEVADVKKAFEAKQTQVSAKLNRLVEQAREAAKPYADIPWATLMKDPQYTVEQINFLQAEAKKAFDNLKFLEDEQTELVKQTSETKQAEALEQARATIKALSDPDTGIKGWNQKLYDDLRGFAVSKGMDADAVSTIVDEKMLRLLHMAYLYDQGQKVTTTRVKKVGKKIVKTTSTPRGPASNKTADSKKAMDRLRKNGSVDSAADAFLARMNLTDDE